MKDNNNPFNKKYFTLFLLRLQHKQRITMRTHQFDFYRPVKWQRREHQTNLQSDKKLNWEETWHLNSTRFSIFKVVRRCLTFRLSPATFIGQRDCELTIEKKVSFYNSIQSEQTKSKLKIMNSKLPRRNLSISSVAAYKLMQ